MYSSVMIQVKNNFLSLPEDENAYDLSHAFTCPCTNYLSSL